MRAALLPEAYALTEPAGGWQLPLAAIVLLGWAAVGTLLAPMALRSMTKKESGSRLGKRQERPLQRST